MNWIAPTEKDSDNYAPHLYRRSTPGMARHEVVSEVWFVRKVRMNGLLVREGIDSTDGCWNAPMRLASGEFAYVTITDTKPLRDGMVRRYDEFIAVARRFGAELPPLLLGQPTHLDPDFEQLTYGDQGQRGKRITSLLTAGDVLVFFAALRPVDGPSRSLIYAIIGAYVVTEIVRAKNAPRSRWAEHAHTRRVPDEGDIVVRAKPGVSGRLRRCIPIGELRDRVYRVRNDLLDAWDGLDIKDGYIHPSVRLPAFNDAAKFHRWLLGQKPELIQLDNCYD